MTVWATGWLINLHADDYLISLRSPGEKNGSYKIPRGGMFEYVSAANYFGEILEWAGWAFAAASVPAAAFALFTFANLAPRGWKHHRWYLQKFKDEYPKTRRAVFPFIW
jgi:3-oxo-5-alpha-steroid 4-dehydrogenase 1